VFVLLIEWNNKLLSPPGWRISFVDYFQDRSISFKTLRGDYLHVLLLNTDVDIEKVKNPMSYFSFLCTLSVAVRNSIVGIPLYPILTVLKTF
jgi:hypothetical protein